MQVPGIEANVAKAQERVGKQSLASEAAERRSTCLLEVVALGNGTEDANSDSRHEESAEDGLQEDGVLDLTKCGLLYPNFAIKDLANDVALLVSGHPGLILPRVA